MGLFQLFSDKTARGLESTDLVPQPLHAILLNVYPEIKQWLIGIGHRLVGYLAVRCTQEQLEEEGSAEVEEMLCTELLCR